MGLTRSGGNRWWGERGARIVEQLGFGLVVVFSTWYLINQKYLRKIWLFTFASRNLNFLKNQNFFMWEDDTYYPLKHAFLNKAFLTKQYLHICREIVSGTRNINVKLQ